MYHAMYPPQIMVQIMGGQQANVHCAPAQTHTLHINNASTYHHPEYPQYRPDACLQNRHHIAQQAGTYPLELLQLIGVEVSSLRHVEYMPPNNPVPSPAWQRRVNTVTSSSVMPSQQISYRPLNNNLVKKTSWTNKTGKRTTYRNNYISSEKYNSDSGFSSRSPTPNKHQPDNSQTESSDEKDSIISSVLDQDIKRPHRVQSDSSLCNRVMHHGVTSSGSVHQFYQHQKPINYYNAPVTLPRQMHTYQSKRRYNHPKFEDRRSPSPERMQKNRKQSVLLCPRFNEMTKFYIAPDRFLAKSHLVEVKRAPNGLRTGSMWDALSEDIWSKFILNQQTEAVYRNKMMLWRYLYLYIKTTFPKYGLYLVGSTMNGFGSNSSDVDMCLLVRHTEMDQRNEAICHLSQILKCLKRCDFIQHLELIQAKVPILKFYDTIQNLEVDLNCNNAVGIRNTHLLYCYSRIDWRVRPLVLVVKLWAQSQNINDAKNMTISSYSLVLMVIHFLQCGVNPPVLPCLHWLYTEKFCSNRDIHSIDIHEELRIPESILQPRNRQPLGELFLGFFKYYVSFDFHQYAISVRLGKKIPIEECQKVRTHKNDPHQWKCLCIEEPFDLTNTARSVYDPVVFARIKYVFKFTYECLKEHPNLRAAFIRADTSRVAAT